MSSEHWGDGTRSVHAGLPDAVPGQPFLPGPVFAAPYHLDPERGPSAATNGYGRPDNPTRRLLETAVGELEGGDCRVFASGQAAITGLLLTLLRPGDTVLLPADGYYSVRAFASDTLEQLGVRVVLVPTAGPYPSFDGVRLVLLETPANPGLDVADIAALAASIGERGLLQPINVREVVPDRFQIVAGERRYWAYRSLERETIPALVIDTDDVQALALIENAQRVDLHPIDLATTLARLIGDKGLTQEQAAVLIGKSQEYVARLLGILRLPARILEEAPDQPAVSVSLLMELAELPDEDAQLALWARAGNGLTVKEVRGAKQERKAARPASPSVAPVLRALRSNVGKMHNLKASGHALAEEQRRELRELRDAIDALLRN